MGLGDRSLSQNVVEHDVHEVLAELLVVEQEFGVQGELGLLLGEGQVPEDVPGVQEVTVQLVVDVLQEEGPVDVLVLGELLAILFYAI